MGGAADIFREEFAALGDTAGLIRLTLRMVLAMALGGALGYERKRQGKPAGTRTHMLVAVGAALVVHVMSAVGGTSADLSRVIQGVITGIGFIGAGAILKVEKREEITGLTTAADVWLTAAVGVAVGAGLGVVAVVATALALVILTVVRRIDGGNGNSGAQR